MRPRFGYRTATPGTLALITLALLVAAGCSSKGTEAFCSDGAICGGSAVGTWDLGGTCQYKAARLDQPLNPGEVVQIPLPPVLTPTPIPPTTAGDWCSQLIYTPLKQVLSVNLWHDAPPLANGPAPFDSSQVSFNQDADSTFSVRLNFAGYYVSHFSPYCIQASGSNPTCGKLAQDLTTFYAASAGHDAANNAYPDFRDIACQTAADNGCDCGYTYQVQVTDTGTWAAGGSLMTMSSSAGTYMLNGHAASSQAPTDPMVASVCQSGNQLTLSGYNGESLFHAPGLRVLTLSKHP